MACRPMAIKTKTQTHVLAIIGAVFFWFCFLCPYKENELGGPAETGLKNSVRDSDSIKKFEANTDQIAAAQKADLAMTA